jgi:signal transduction histidine kinase
LPSLFVIRGNDQGVRFDLEADRVTLGREASNTIQLHDREVSREHAELRREGDQFIVADLGSSNGTFVNGVRVRSQQLTTGDHVQIGRTMMLFTGVTAESSKRLQERVGIVEQTVTEPQSRIVRSMSQTEGSQLLPPAGAADARWMVRARSHLEVIYRAALAVSHTLDIDQLLERIMQLIFDSVDADNACIMLIDADTGELRPQVHRSRGRERDGKLNISRTILDYVVENKQGVLTSNAQQDDRFNPEASIMRLGIREAICVPMQARYDVVGVIYLDTTTSAQQVMRAGSATDRFNEEHLQLLIAIAHQAALAVEDTRYYSAMVQAERLAAMGQTIATLSHHIKNILQGVRASSFLIEDGLRRHDENMIRQGWEFVERNQKRISDLVMDMLAYSKQREPELLPADLNTVVGEVVDLMRQRANDAGVGLDWQPGAAVPVLTFDPEALHRAVLNVVINAIDACEGRPAALVKATTSYSADEALARIVVEDNGPGIEPENLAKIFTLFMSTKRSRGTGLGLPVSQKIMQEHGGRIAAESEPEKGSRFILELPAVLPDMKDAGATMGQPLDASSEQMR